MTKLKLLLLALIVASCQNGNQESTIDATAKDVKDGTKVYLATLGENGRPEPLDTTEVKNGKFEIDLPQVDYQSLNILQLENNRGNVLFINENEPLTVTIFKDSLQASKVNGGEQSAIFQDYMDLIKEQRSKFMALRDKYSDPKMMQDPDTRKKIMAEQQEITEAASKKQQKMVEDHPESIVSVLILSDMMNMKAASISEVHKMYDDLDSKVKETTPGKSLGEMLEKSGVTEVGNKAPEFEAPTPEGETLSLKDALGKVTLVDFWASWCKPCREENPNIVKVYEKYHDKGLNILGVSLDKEGQKDKWLKAIEDDHLTWQHVSNLKFWKGPIAQKYNIRSIPASFILDENGKIVARDLRGADLDKKIGELLE